MLSLSAPPTEPLAQGSLSTPVGELVVTTTARALIEVGFRSELDPLFVAGRARRSSAASSRSEPIAARAAEALLAAALLQLEEYLAGGRRTFDLPLAPAPTSFQATVRQALIAVPFGETVTYGELAARIGRPTASRAVGGANHKNPIGIIVPCHRVIGQDGTLTGYAGGLDRKAFLLALEQPTRH